MFIEGHETTDFVLFIDFTLCDLIPEMINNMSHGSFYLNTY